MTDGAMVNKPAMTMSPAPSHARSTSSRPCARRRAAACSRMRLNASTPRLCASIFRSRVNPRSPGARRDVRLHLLILRVLGPPHEKILQIEQVDVWKMGRKAHVYQSFSALSPPSKESPTPTSHFHRRGYRSLRRFRPSRDRTARRGLDCSCKWSFGFE